MWERKQVMNEETSKFIWKTVNVGQPERVVTLLIPLADENKKTKSVKVFKMIYNAYILTCQSLLISEDCSNVRFR